MAKSTYKYEPDYAVAPGEIMEETLDAYGMKKTDLAMRCGLTPKTISQIIAGKAPVTAETALQLEKVLGISADVWNNLESNYRLFLARRQQEERMAGLTDWIRQFPLTDLRRKRVVSGRRVNEQTVSEVLDFLGLAGPSAWNHYIDGLQLAAHRAKTFESSPHAVACWLRLAEKQVEERVCESYDKKKFKDTLTELRQLTMKNPSVFEPEIVERCASAGVAVAFVGELDKTHIAGATRWLDTDKALLALSLRHKTDDHFWFTFFHEAAHILLHGKREFFLDETNAELDEQEMEANQFASDILIPQSAWRKFVGTGSFTKASIRRFARSQNLAPGIVVGRLQKEKRIKWAWHNDLKRRFELSE